MPTPRKPSLVHKMSGAFKQNPSRGRERINEPTPTGDIGNAPSHLSDDEQRVWREVRKSAYWLTDADRHTLESLCHMVAKMRSVGGLNASDYGQLRNFLGCLGLTPADRSKVQAMAKPEKQIDDDPWAILQRPGNTVRKPSSKRGNPGGSASTPIVPKVPVRPN